MSNSILYTASSLETIDKLSFLDFTERTLKF